MSAAPATSIAEQIRARQTAQDPNGDALPEHVWCGTFADLDALEMPDPRVVVSVAGIELREQEVMLVRGQANVYKSFLTLDALVSVAARGASAFLLAGEGGRAALRKRLRGLGAHRKLTREHKQRIRVVHGSFDLAEHVAAYVRLLGTDRPALVVVDPLIEYNGGDENDAQDMRRIVGAIGEAKQVGAAVLLVHHSTKENADGKSTARGSSVLRGAVDHELVIAQTNEPGKVVVTHEKNREGEKVKPRFVAWTFTDETIGSEVIAATAEDVASEAEKRHTTKLLGHLALEDLAFTDARSKLGMSSSTLHALVNTLATRGRLRPYHTKRPDGRGRLRDVEMLTSRLGDTRTVPEGMVPEPGKRISP